VAITQHLIDPMVVAFSEWGKLDAKEQAVVTEGARFAIDIARAMSSAREAESLAQLKKLGMTITYPDMTEACTKHVWTFMLAETPVLLLVLLFPGLSSWIPTYFLQ
jgi:TRAP-type C4-dicarboxylate transport system substrate-binding protein